MVDPEKIEAYAKTNGFEYGPDMMNETGLRETIYSDILRLADENKLNSLEKPKQMKLLLDPFTIESDILTPTMKLKRNVAKNMFQKDIEDLYAMPPMNHKK